MKKEDIFQVSVDDMVEHKKSGKIGEVTSIYYDDEYKTWCLTTMELDCPIEDFRIPT